MICRLLPLTLLLACFPFLTAVAEEAPGETVAPKSIEALCTEFSSFDRNGDGQVEITSLKLIASAGTSGSRVVMFVEPRLLQPLEGGIDLAPQLERWADDLAAEGHRAEVIAVELAKCDFHQDGQFILALRDLLRAIAKEGELEGVVLVGHFPDSSIVRTCNWRKNGDVALRRKTPEAKTYIGVRHLRRHPELVAKRADIVLADLDGRWEDVYVQPRTKLDSVMAVFDDRIPTRGGDCLDAEVGSTVYQDFFHISDGAVELSQRLDAEGNVIGPTLRIMDEVGNDECSDADGTLNNGLSQPDIFVSRLDARGVALSPRDDIAGVDGEKLLDENGKPQTIRFTSAEEVPKWNRLWRHDPVLERRLLAEYFDRNHAYRRGEVEVAWRPSSIACDLGSGFRSMSRAATDWEAADHATADLRGRPNLVNFVEWMEYPAVLRTVRAHSDATTSRFRKAKPSQLDAALEGTPWSWTQRDDRLEPSLASACGGGALNFYLMRSLWENGKVAPQPSFYHHTGCNAISPYGAESYPYDHPSYGARNGAEALLLYGNGLALVGRSKVYFDEPAGFAEALREGANYGKAWSEYFRIEANSAKPLPPGSNVGRKRAYYWSVLGDWTLRLATAAPAAEDS